MTEQALTRGELLIAVGNILRKMGLRLSAERFQPSMVDSEFLAYCRAFTQLATASNAILRDAELAEILERLEALEEEAKHARR